MSSLEGRWLRAKGTLGDALQDNRDVTAQYERTSERAPEIIDLARQNARAEAALELARVNLDLALLQDRRSRSAHDHAGKVALLRGASPDSLDPYMPDAALTEAQAAFDAAQTVQQAVEQMRQEMSR
jgi:hypothetical protein